MHPEIPDSNLNEGIEMRPLESYITVLYWFDRRKRPGLSINSNKKSKGSYSKSVFISMCMLVPSNVNDCSVCVVRALGGGSAVMEQSSY